ncbi:hypothetical protein YPN_0261 [Yersinia pestis Nepal516]|uniref:Uncharacterized protein n=4 Tax=Yersinia pestis TaxID=632 RepID=Q7CG33_YERPE|nr:hypothetical [Yersinia pestis KIM10+]ABG15855.1 hypothetical protein YPA_3894 [Yersinia pestis Antiqua]ABG16594.1 hypothetical protein YPN_0261 [Yersinia pestis Nepal516]EDM40052.1 hypothetical protein YPE_2879 [Yersinia pestis CA88-4125]CAL19071.1 hypothetical protein YPO0390 [Yersinia pestis CO92]
MSLQARRCDRPVASHINTQLPASGLSSVLSAQGHLKRLLIQHGFGQQLLESGVLFLKRLQTLNLGHLHTAILFTQGVKRGVGNGVLAAEFTGGYPGFSLAENTDDLLVGKTLLHGDVLMWFMKTLLTSGSVNQRGAGQGGWYEVLASARVSFKGK